MLHYPLPDARHSHATRLPRFLPRRPPRAELPVRGLARRGPALRLRRIRGARGGNDGTLPPQIRRRNPLPVVPFHRPGRARHRPAPRTHPLARPHGGGPAEGFPQTHEVVRNRSLLPRGKADARPPPRVHPVQRRHPRRGLPRRRRRTHRPHHRRAARPRVFQRRYQIPPLEPLRLGQIPRRPQGAGRPDMPPFSA